jgi:hypothetical protein
VIRSTLVIFFFPIQLLFLFFHKNEKKATAREPMENDLSSREILRRLQMEKVKSSLPPPSSSPMPKEKVAITNRISATVTLRSPNVPLSLQTPDITWEWKMDRLFIVTASRDVLQKIRQHKDVVHFEHDWRRFTHDWR